MSAKLESALSAGIQLFDGFLRRTIEPRILSGVPSQLSQPMLYSLMAPGKRFRPFLLLLHAGVDLGREREQAASVLNTVLSASAAVECIHTYSLIHDDLPAMDDDDLRRGRPSCHIAFGEWAAILAGDALNTLAFELLTGESEHHSFGGTTTGTIGVAAGMPSAHSSQQRLALVRILSQAAGMQGMVAGQALDLAAERAALEHTPQLLDSVHIAKTAALIGAACEMGAVLAGAGRDTCERARAFGTDLGLLFQITDDLMDELGDSALMGKHSGKDQQRGKLTYPGLHGIERSRKRCAELRERLEAQVPGLLDGVFSERDNSDLLMELIAFTAERKR